MTFFGILEFDETMLGNGYDVRRAKDGLQALGFSGEDE
jgi:hypothetical protein